MITGAHPVDDAVERVDRMLASTAKVARDEFEPLYDALPAVSCEEMLGAWDGRVVPVGHLAERLLGLAGWRGKAFPDAEHVRPLVCEAPLGRLGAVLVGGARLREVTHRGVTTATMLYDRLPIADHFRALPDGRRLGWMDRKGDARPCIFVLEPSDRPA